jgi:undecaprenyl-diphosphatase
MHALLLNERFGSVYKFVRPLLTTLVVLISFSRIYLGQHYLTDVIAGVAVAAAIYFGLQYLSKKVTWQTPTVVLASMPLLLILLFVFQEKNLWITVAGMLGGTIGYQLEQRFIQFDVKATLPIQGFKFVLGIAVTLGLQEGLKLVFPYANATEFMTLVWDFLRYALLVMWVTLGAPATFKLLFQRKAA